MDYGTLKRWLYKGQRPNWFAKILNSGWAVIHALGIAPNYLVTLEVPGRKSGKIVSVPLVMAVVDQQRYLVSMLGDNVQWLRNVRANGDQAVIHCGGREAVRLDEIPPAQRAAIIKAYLKRAPGARPHVPVDMNAPLADFEAIAADFPVFHVVSLSIIE